MSVIEIYHINPQSLRRILEKEQSKSDYTRGDLDKLQENFQNNLFQILDTSDVRLTINHTKGEIEIAEISSLEDAFDILPLGFPEDPSKGVYRHVRSAMRQAGEMGVFDEIFIKEDS